VQVRIVTQQRTARGFEICEIPKVIDWNNSSDRKWLANHTHWAMTNDKLVIYMPYPFESTSTHLQGDSDVRESA